MVDVFAAIDAPLSVLNLVPFSVKLASVTFCTASENLIVTLATAVLVGVVTAVQVPVGAV